MSGLAIRPATAADAGLILALVQELALFERAPEAVRATAEDFRRELGAGRPGFECLIAEVGAEPVGMALFFHNFSTWEGRRGIYLEDLYVREAARGSGAGQALVTALAALAVERGCTRLDLSVLDWNPARGFYERLGLRPMTDWVRYRAEGAALARLATGPA